MSLEPMSKMLMPLGDRVLIQQHTDEQKSALAIPDEAKGEMKQAFGRVIAIGEGDEVKKLGLQGSATVYFNKFSGERVTFEGQEYILLRSNEILAHVVLV